MIGTNLFTGQIGQLKGDMTMKRLILGVLIIAIALCLASPVYARDKIYRLNHALTDSGTSTGWSASGSGSSPLYVQGNGYKRSDGSPILFLDDINSEAIYVFQIENILPNQAAQARGAANWSGNTIDVFMKTSITEDGLSSVSQYQIIPDIALSSSVSVYPVDVTDYLKIARFARFYFRSGSTGLETFNAVVFIRDP